MSAESRLEPASGIREAAGPTSSFGCLSDLLFMQHRANLPEPGAGSAGAGRFGLRNAINADEKRFSATDRGASCA